MGQTKLSDCARVFLVSWLGLFSFTGRAGFGAEPESESESEVETKPKTKSKPKAKKKTKNVKKVTPPKKVPTPVVAPPTPTAAPETLPRRFDWLPSDFNGDSELAPVGDGLDRLSYWAGFGLGIPGNVLNNLNKSFVLGVVYNNAHVRAGQNYCCRPQQA